MNPWLIGGAAAGLAALFAFSSSASTSASQDQMVFKDYTWVTSLPAMAATENRPPNPLAADLPPPPGSTGPGKWAFFPGGKLLLKKSGGADPMLGGSAHGGLSMQIWPGVPAGIDVYAWYPSVGNSPTSMAHHQWGMSKINGFWVSFVPYHVQALGKDSQGHDHFHWQSASGHYPPPPPGVGHGSGHWKMVHPGYIVWLTPSTQNQAASDTGQYGSSYGFTLAPQAQPLAPQPVA